MVKKRAVIFFICPLGKNVDSFENPCIFLGDMDG